MNDFTFFWHDYESTGTDPRRDRPSQFAGVRTNIKLEPVAEPVVIYCQPAIDRLPQPEACLITGITPQKQASEGIPENDFAAQIHAVLAEPGTCGAGYNSIRFDDELTRHLFYRNFYDPYAREWENDNSRWDIIDLGRLCYALRPEGIEWPLYDDGTPNFRLEDLAAANHLSQTRAHDALSDVYTTIDLARLILQKQPRLFEWHHRLRHKKRAFELLDWVQMTPVLHASQRYRASQGCLTMVAPLAQHPSNSNGVIVYDLSVDPTPLIELEVDEIRDRVFVAQRDRPDDIPRVPLKLVHANRSPALAPLSALTGTNLSRIRLNPQQCEQHLERLRACQNLADKVRRVFDIQPDNEQTKTDCELALYQKFLSGADRSLLRKIRQSNAEELTNQRFAFQDKRYTELLFRYRAKHYPHLLNHEESEQWRQHRMHHLLKASDNISIDYASYLLRIQTLRTQVSTQQHVLLDALEAWGKQLTQDLEL
jgi:exodeoxyribonuclease-1